MRFFFDTEFFDKGRIIDLISIGIVAEDGREYYAEMYGAEDLCREDHWLTLNVLPHLRGGGALQFRDFCARDIAAFVGDKPEFWAYFADYDWVALCQLYGRMIDLPKGWPLFCLDLMQSMHERGISHRALPKNDGAHDALADARWTAAAWRQVMA